MITLVAPAQKEIRVVFVFLSHGLIVSNQRLTKYVTVCLLKSWYYQITSSSLFLSFQFFQSSAGRRRRAEIVVLLGRDVGKRKKYMSVHFSNPLKVWRCSSLPYNICENFWPYVAVRNKTVLMCSPHFLILHRVYYGQTVNVYMYTQVSTYYYLPPPALPQHTHNQTSRNLIHTETRHIKGIISKASNAL